MLFPLPAPFSLPASSARLSPDALSTAGMVLMFDMACKLIRIIIDRTQRAGGIALRLVVEMR